MWVQYRSYAVVGDVGFVVGGPVDCFGNCDRPTAIGDSKELVENATWYSSFPIDNDLDIIGDMTPILLSFSVITLSIYCLCFHCLVLSSSSVLCMHTDNILIISISLSDRIDFLLLP